jgi:hypothetical protein
MDNLSPIIFNSITIVLSAIIYVYITNLEKDNCDCSKISWLRDFVKYGSIVHIAYLGVLILLAITKPSLLLKIPMTILALFFVYIISYFIISIVYYFHLVKKNDCECSYNWKRKYLMYPLIYLPFIILGIVSFVVITIIIKKSIKKGIRKRK